MTLSTLDLLVDLVGADRASIPQLLAARVVRTPDNVFLLWGDAKWTYALLWDEVRRFAGFLSGIGQGGPGRRVATYLTNCPPVFWTWFGTQLTGATYVSLNRAHRGAILADMLARSGSPLLVTEASALDLLPPARHIGVTTLLLVDDAPPRSLELGYHVLSWDAVREAPMVEGMIPTPSEVGTIMFTSGTTGRSKAVLLPHNQFCRGAAHAAYAIGLSPDDVFHGWVPLFHIAGQMHMTLGTILAGGAIALFPAFSRSSFWSQVRATKCTIFMGFPVIVELLDGLPPSPDDRTSSLRAGINANMPPALHRPFEERFDVTIVDTYGMTEMEIITLPLPADGTPVGSCGPPGPDFEVTILDDHDRPLPPRQVGEIAARPKVPDVIMRGYEGDDAATVAAFRNLWFHTGDLGYRDEGGFLFFVGRRKDAIRRRGENISALEVERILAEHPAVAECAVLGVPAAMGEEDVKAVVVPREGWRVDLAEMRSFCGERMARFMIPRYFEIRDRLPRSDIGKVEKDRLRDLPADVWDAEAP